MPAQRVTLNGVEVASHNGGYSTFRADITTVLGENNELTVEVDNSKNDRVYPQKADFTFYGGIYRDVTLLVVNKNHLCAGLPRRPGRADHPTVNGSNADIHVKSWTEGDGEVEFTVYEADGSEVVSGKGSDTTVTIEHPHLWDGVRDPYLYTCVVRLVLNGEVQDEVSQRFGVRSFSVDSSGAFSSMAVRIRCMASPAIRTARVWATPSRGRCTTRICSSSRSWGQTRSVWHTTSTTSTSTTSAMKPVWSSGPKSYISEHMPNGRENTISQMKELIVQNSNHACIVCWGVSNEITISTKDNRDMRDNHHVLNDLCHEMDKDPPDHAGLLMRCAALQPGGPHH